MKHLSIYYFDIIKILPDDQNRQENIHTQQLKLFIYLFWNIKTSVFS